MYMELCPEAGKQLHHTMCSSIDSLPGHRLDAEGSIPPPDKGGSPRGTGTLAAPIPFSQSQENAVPNGQDSGSQHSSGSRRSAGHWDIEKGGASSGSLTSLSRLSSIMENPEVPGGSRGQSLPHWEPSGCALLLRTKSLPGPVLIPGSVFSNAALPFVARNSGLHSRAWKSQHTAVRRVAAAQQSSMDRASARSPQPQPQPQPPPPPSSKQALRELLLTRVSACEADPELSQAGLPPQELHSEADGERHPGGPSLVCSAGGNDAEGAAPACSPQKMASDQYRAWLQSRSVSVQFDDNPFK
jgi:hypothetical protein